jgi:ketosteroid isomerase-like protein
MPEVAINKAEWQTFEGETLDEFRLTDLIASARGRAVFRAVSTTDGTDAIFAITDAAATNTDVLRRRYLEASFLDNEHLLKVRGIGFDEKRSRRLFYAALESSDRTLSEICKTAKPDAAQTRDLILQIGRALSYLHRENLVYCALATESVWRVGELWKLGDFSELRLPGNADLRETRALMTRDASAPPEAFEGIVSPAWDVWSVGWMLSKLSTPNGPFDAVIGACLEPKPSDRPEIDRVIRDLETLDLAAARTARPAPPNEPVEESAVFVRPTPIPETLSATNRQHERRRLMLYALLGALTVLIVTVIVMFWRAIDSTIPASETARTHTIVVPTQPAASTTGVTDRSGNADREAPPDSNSVRGLLDRWAASIRNHDVDAQVACYAPNVDQYFGLHNVTQQKIREQKQRLFSQIGTVRQFDVSNVQVQQNGPNRATISFDKTWDFGQRKRFAGSERAVLTVAKISGEWRIVAEKEGKIYWVKHWDGSSPG